MATKVIMPALEMAQETGKILQWLKREGERVSKGEPIMEIETDKVTVQIEATADGILSGIIAREGDSIPVGHTIAWILAPGESVPPDPKARSVQNPSGLTATPVARQIAAEHGIDLAQVKASGARIEKADVLAHLTSPPTPLLRGEGRDTLPSLAGKGAGGLGVPASPKARRLAQERGIEIASLRGSGLDGAVIVADIPIVEKFQSPTSNLQPPVSTVWRVMAERMTQAWTTVPHFYLTREVAASALVEMRARIAPAVEKKIGVKPTFTDLLVKLVATTLRHHPRVNASWIDGTIRSNDDIHIGIATAVEDGLIVPVIRNADRLGIGEIAVQRKDQVERASSRKLRPTDIADGTFTITNLGMYNVDAFNAIVNPPQAAILAIGRIADRVVPIDGQPAVRPMMILTLSCDHRVVDGARGAQFLDALANLIEEPWGLLA